MTSTHEIRLSSGRVWRPLLRSLPRSPDLLERSLICHAISSRVAHCRSMQVTTYPFGRRPNANPLGKLLASPGVGCLERS